ncbi:MAG: hypothetical protein HFACDABA_01278 [Anaerolineales bacterium]|nr:hypothetical protein [Anaerolineales bacterium]
MQVEINGPHGATLHEARGNPDLIQIACNLFESIFPEDRRYIPYIRACAQGTHPAHPNTRDHVWLVRHAGEWVGVRVFSFITTRNFGHGAYIGFTDALRGKGLGRWLVEQTHVQLEMDARQLGRPGSIGYLVEVERPADAESGQGRSDSERRLRFHRRCGAIILPVPFMEPVMIEGVDYLSPSDLAGESPRPMHLVWLPSEHGKKVQALNLVDLIHGLYLDVYRLPTNHLYVRRALAPLLE